MALILNENTLLSYTFYSGTFVWKYQCLQYMCTTSKDHIFGLIVVVWEMEVIYSKMLGGFVWNHSHAAKVEIYSWGWRLTSHPSPPHPFPYLVSVRRRCVERLSHCRCASSTGILAQTFSDQHSVWLMCKAPAFSGEVCASRLDGWFRGRATHSWILAYTFVDLWIPISLLIDQINIRGYLLGPKEELLSQPKDDKYVCIPVPNF